VKLLHLADVHVGALTHSRIEADSGLPSALVSSLRCLEAAVDVALEAAVDLVIVAGDLYHAPNPSAAALVGVQEQLDRLRVELIPTIVYPGNHDRAAHPGQRSVLSVHAGGSVEVVEADRVLGLGDEIAVGVLPSFSRQRYGNIPRADAEARTVEDLERTLGSWDAGDPVVPDVISGHWPVSGSMLGGETDIALIPEPMLSPADLDGPWMYAAFGHIHRAQAITSGERVVGGYSGSTDRGSFGEETYEPSVDLVTLDESDGVAVERVTMPARIFRTIELENPIVGDLSTPDLLAANEGGIFRIRGRFAEGEPHRTAVAMAREMARVLQDSGASIVRVEVEAERPARARIADITQAPTELDALERWIESNEIEDDVAAGLREFAAQISEGLR
jgi:exonuclease SbcD